MRTSTIQRNPDLGYAELIERLQALPRDKQVEVFDFVEFLARRSNLTESPASGPGEWSDSEFSLMAMAQALRVIEDDPVAYSTADLQERWQ